MQSTSLIQLHLLAAGLLLMTAGCPSERRVMDSRSSEQRTHTICGLVFRADGEPVSDMPIVVDGTDYQTVTGTNGTYCLELPQGLAGIVRPERTGYTVSPSGWEFGSLSANVDNVDFRVVGAPDKIAISGLVLETGGYPVQNVVLAADNGGGQAVTDASGTYSLEVDEGWSGTITPSAAAYSFNPQQLSLTSVDSDLTGQNFVAQRTPAYGNYRPQALPQTLSTLEDTALAITLRGTDADGDTLTAVVLSLPASGSLLDAGTDQEIAASQLPYALGDADNGVVYVPDKDYSASDDSDSFTFQMNDGTEVSVASSVQIAVSPVNDPPTFYAPAQVAVPVGIRSPINLGNISAGADNENDQTLTLTATSSNQSILPNSAIEIADTALHITPASIGSTTITLTARDDGGTDNGGDDESDAVEILVTVNELPSPTGENQNVRAFVDTPEAIVLQAFDGNGHRSLSPRCAALEFTITSEPQFGTLYGDAPNLTYTPNSGFAGTDSFQFVVNDGLSTSEPAEAVITVAAWSTPLGIPEPPFGIEETAGTPTYYIDPSHPNATDDGNTYGTVDQPRLTIPATLDLGPGDVVQVAAGEYTITPNELKIRGGGTAENPAFVRGISATDRPLFDKRVSFYQCDGYVIVENFAFTAAPELTPGIEISGETHHIAMRNCEFTQLTASPIRVFGVEPTGVHDVTLFNNLIHDNGDWLADFDEDCHGVAVGRYSYNVWILDNEFYHNSGNGVQVNASHKDYEETTHHIYIGRNTAHHNKQSGLWTKFADHVIFSQNRCFAAHPVYPNPSSPGEGIGGQYGPAHAWIIFNEIYECDNGIRFSTEEGGGGIGRGENIYVLGNLIHDIHHSTLDVTGEYEVPYDTDDAWSPGRAVAIWHASATKHIVGNTFHNVDGGVYVTRQDNTVVIANNIFSEVDDFRAGNGDLDVCIEQDSAAAVSLLHNNLFSDSARIRWGSDRTLYTVSGFETVFSDHGWDNHEGGPVFADASSGDFRPDANSAAIDNAVAYSAFDEFFTLYGIDIHKDLFGSQRPVDGDNSNTAEWDIGAFEAVAD